MKLHELRPADGARFSPPRGPGWFWSRQNGGRGHKGRKPAPAAVCAPVSRRPDALAAPHAKRVFNNKFRKEIIAVNVEQLNRFEDGATVNPETLLAARVIHKTGDEIKILGNGNWKSLLPYKPRLSTSRPGKRLRLPAAKRSDLIAG